MSKIISWDDKGGARRTRDLLGMSQKGFFISPPFENKDTVLKKNMRNVVIEEKKKRRT